MKLSICSDPMFRENHDTAFAFSILEAQNIFTKEWVIKNFFSMIYTDYIKQTNIYLLYWPCFKRKIVFLPKKKTIVSDICALIKKGYYVHVALNERFIPDREAYNLKNYTHNLLIYGYDYDNKLFYTIAYNKKKIYAKQTISFLDIYNAIVHCSLKIVQIYGIKPKKNYNHSSLTFSKLTKNIIRYIHPKSKLRGISVYDKIIKMLYSDPQDSSKFLDPRSFRTIMQHFKLLNFIPIYFNLSDLLVSEINEMEKEATILFYTIIKFNLSQKKTNQEIIYFIKKINYLKNRELNILNQIIEEIDDNKYK